MRSWQSRLLLLASQVFLFHFHRQKKSDMEYYLPSCLLKHRHHVLLAAWVHTKLKKTIPATKLFVLSISISPALPTNISSVAGSAIRFFWCNGIPIWKWLETKNKNRFDLNSSENKFLLWVVRNFNFLQLFKWLFIDNGRRNEMRWTQSRYSSRQVDNKKQ